MTPPACKLPSFSFVCLFNILVLGTVVTIIELEFTSHDLMHVSFESLQPYRTLLSNAFIEQSDCMRFHISAGCRFQPLQIETFKFQFFKLKFEKLQRVFTAFCGVMLYWRDSIPPKITARK